MKARNQFFSVLILLSLLVVFLPQVQAAFNDDYLRGDFACNNPYTLRYYGFVTGDPDSGIGISSLSSWKQYFDSSSRFTQTCIPGRVEIRGDADEDDVGGALFGGFLYVVDDSVMFNSILQQVQGPYSNAGVHSDYSYALLPLPETAYDLLQTTYSSQNFKNFFSSAETSSAIYSQYLNLRSTRDNLNEQTDNIFVNVQQGIYVIQAGIDMQTGRGSSTRDGFAILQPINFGDSNTYITNTNLNQFTNGYAITNRPLSVSEINSEFGIQVDNNAFLCSLTGGDFKSGLDENGVNRGVCCGNLLSDEGQEYTFNGVIDRCVTDSLGDFTWQNDKNYCEDIPFNGDFIESVQENYAATDGSDGCCGDDSGEYGFITADGQYFCNNDLLANGNIINPSQNADGLNKYWGTVGNEFLIHTVDQTDFITNGDEWYECFPTDTTANNNLIGTTERMQIPLREISNFNTCTGAMNYLLGSGAFHLLDEGKFDPPTGTIFEDSTQANNLEGWSCSPDANNDMINFFSSTVTSCVESCYLTPGNKVRSLNTSITDLTNYLCSFGLDIAACPDSTQGQISQQEIIDGTYDVTYLNIVNSCTDIGTVVEDPNGYAGYLCQSPNTVCATGEYFQTPDTDVENNQVCCKAQEGSFYSSVCLNPDAGNQNIPSQEIVDNPSNAFLCQSWNNENRFIECCGEDLTECKNAQANAQYQQNGRDSGMYVTAGASNYLIADFDVYNGVELERLSDTKQNIVAGDPYVLDIQTLSTQQRDVSNWAGFRTLEFDVLFNQESLADPYEFVLVYDTPTQTNQEYRTLLRNQLVDGTAPGIFHHTVISLPQNIQTAKRIEIHTTTSLFGLFIQLDNIFLSNHVSESPNYFCTGDYGLWVEDLDGPNGNQGFSSDALVSEYAAYQVGCNAVPSFGWTGTRCCGDDNTQTIKETYVDENGACYEGNAVSVDQVVGVATKEADQADLLYHNKEFYYCQTNPQENPYQNQNNLNISQIGDIVADHACTDDGEWLPVGSISNTKLLASYMYNIISQEPSYSLHCENLVRVSPGGDQEILSYFTGESLDVFCGAQIFEEQPTNNQGNRTLLGFMVTGEQTNETFMQALATYFTAIHLLQANEYDAFLQACDEVTESSQDQFFSCQPQGEGDTIRVLVNGDKTIYLISYVQNQVADFRGLFETNTLGDYFENVIYFFTNLFTGWYTESDTDEVDTRLPNVLSTTSFNLDAVVIRGDQMENGTYKTVTGFIEKDSNDNLIVIEYENFHTSVQPLAQRYYGELSELNYQRGTNRQVIQLQENLANERIYSFEPVFDWRLITTALRIDNQNNGSYVTAQLNDGILDIGEECDTGQRVEYDAFGNEITVSFEVFKNMNGNTCAEYLPNIYTNTDALITCVDGVIDVSACNFCGDGQVSGSETCDDGNTLNGDGCTSQCQIEFCGDSIVSYTEVCDDGNTITEGYQAVACSQASNCNSECTGFGGCIGDAICQDQELQGCQLSPLSHTDCQYCDGDGDGVSTVNDCDDNDPTVTRCTGTGGGTGGFGGFCSGTYELGRCIDETNSGCNVLVETSYSRTICESNFGCSWLSLGTGVCDPDWEQTECELRGCTYN